MIDSFYIAFPALALSFVGFLGYDRTIARIGGAPVGVSPVVVLLLGIIYPPLTYASWWTFLPFLGMTISLLMIAAGRPAPTSAGNQG
jgi:hypothetical protein